MYIYTMTRDTRYINDIRYNIVYIRYINNDTRYINPKSNHSLSILKQIPAAISKRISIDSSNKNKYFKKQHLKRLWV